MEAEVTGLGILKLTNISSDVAVKLFIIFTVQLFLEPYDLRSLETWARKHQHHKDKIKPSSCVLTMLCRATRPMMLLGRLPEEVLQVQSSGE
jgi:hypothetical protein